MNSFPSYKFSVPLDTNVSVEVVVTRKSNIIRNFVCTVPQCPVVLTSLKSSLVSTTVSTLNVPATCKCIYLRAGTNLSVQFVCWLLTSQQQASVSQGQIFQCSLFVGCLRPSNRLVYLRDKSFSAVCLLVAYVPATG